MSDNTILNTGTGGDTIATDDIAGVKHQRVKIEYGVDGSATDVSSSTPLPVVQTGTPGLPTGAATETTLAALNTKVTAVNTGAVTVASSALPTGAATAAKQPALGTAGSSSADVLTVQGRASMTPILTDASATTQPVSGTVSAAQSGTWTVQPGNTANTTAWKVDGSAVTQPVSASSLPLPTGAATETTLSALNTKTPAVGQTTMSASVPVVIASDQSAVAVKGSTTAGSAVPTTPVLTGLKDSSGNLQSVLGAPSSVSAVASTAGIPYGGQALYSGTGNYTPLANIAVGKAQSSGNIISAAGMIGFDGTNYQAAKMNSSGDQTIGASSTGGGTPTKLVSAATTNATSVKASAGTVYHISAGNVNAAARYVKLYNKASAPTVGTDVPVLTFIIPGNTAGAGTNLPIGAPGINFSTGIAFALTTGVADSDTGAVAANEITLNLTYA